MLIYLFVALFCIALIITLVGLRLSPRPHVRTQREVTYAPRARRGVSQGNRTRNVRQQPAVAQPYRQSKRSYAANTAAAVPSTSGWMASPWGARFPHWLKLTLLSGAIFGLCLLLFVQVMNGNKIAMIFDISEPQTVPAPANTTMYAENLGASDASKSIVRVAQLDQTQYSSPDEYNKWSPSACSVAAMTEIINAYGHNYRLTDILKAQVAQHAISPELGLLESKGIDRTVAQFGFKMVPFQRPTLDAAIAVANQGHPVIISFANSGYWPGGHILVLRGGDAQNVTAR